MVASISGGAQPPMIRNRHSPMIQHQLNGLPGRVRMDVEMALDELEYSPLPPGYTIVSNSPKHMMKVNDTTEILYVSDMAGHVTIVVIRHTLWNRIRRSGGI